MKIKGSPFLSSYCILTENNIEFKVDRAKDKDIVKDTIRPDDIKIVNEDSENTIDGSYRLVTDTKPRI